MLEFSINKSSFDQIFSHLSECDSAFIPPLSQKTDIASYSKKISENAITFEAFSSGKLVGLVAAYLNDKIPKEGFITNVSVEKSFWRKGISNILLERCIIFFQECKVKAVRLEVSANNTAALGLYMKKGFQICERKNDMLLCALVLNN